MAITLHGTEYPDIELGADCRSEEAVHRASELHGVVGSDACTEAVVDRFDGLVLFFIINGTRVGEHFQHALAGFTGADTLATATILELFGFGTKMEILARVSLGDTTAFYSFKKRPL